MFKAQLEKNKFILFIDEIGVENQMHLIIESLFEINKSEYKNYNLIDAKIDHNNYGPKTNILLPPISQLLVHMQPNDLFKTIRKLTRNENVQTVFGFATANKISEHFIVPFLEHMAHVIFELQLDKILKVTTKSTSHSRLSIQNYTITKDETKAFVVVKQSKQMIPKIIKPAINPESLGTFKIKIEDEEMIARNALQLPYEKAIRGNTSGEIKKESQIIYHPSAEDDFDDEDPDDDLDI